MALYCISAVPSEPWGLHISKPCAAAQWSHTQEPLHLCPDARLQYRGLRDRPAPHFVPAILIHAAIRTPLGQVQPRLLFDKSSATQFWFTPGLDLDEGVDSVYISLEAFNVTTADLESFISALYVQYFDPSLLQAPSIVPNFTVRVAIKYAPLPSQLQAARTTVLIPVLMKSIGTWIARFTHLLPPGLLLPYHVPATASSKIEFITMHTNVRVLLTPQVGDCFACCAAGATVQSITGLSTRAFAAMPNGGSQDSVRLGEGMALCSSRSPDTIPDGQPVDTYYAFTWQHVDPQRIDSGIQIVRSTWDAGVEQLTVVWSRLTTQLTTAYIDGQIFSVQGRAVRGPVACRMDYAGSDSEIVMAVTTATQNLSREFTDPTVSIVRLRATGGMRLDRAGAPGLEAWAAVQAISLDQFTPDAGLNDALRRDSSFASWGMSLSWCGSTMLGQPPSLLVGAGNTVYALELRAQLQLVRIAFGKFSNSNLATSSCGSSVSCTGLWRFRSGTYIFFGAACPAEARVLIGFMQIPHREQLGFVTPYPLTGFYGFPTNVESFERMSLASGTELCGDGLGDLLLTIDDSEWPSDAHLWGPSHCRGCGRVYLVCVHYARRWRASNSWEAGLNITELQLAPDGRSVWHSAANGSLNAFGASITTPIVTRHDPIGRPGTVALSFLVGAPNTTAMMSILIAGQAASGTLLRYSLEYTLITPPAQQAKAFPLAQAHQAIWPRAMSETVVQPTCVAGPWGAWSHTVETEDCYNTTSRERHVGVPGWPLWFTECPANYESIVGSPPPSCGAYCDIHLLLAAIMHTAAPCLCTQLHTTVVRSESKYATRLITWLPAELC